MIYDINEIKIIKDLTISVDGETDIKYIDKNNEEVEKWITSELLVELYREKDKEIERLTLELSGYREAILRDKEMLGLKEENTRLNNIINEIRKWLEEDYKETINNEICDYPRYYLDKFDEIVGSGKE